jgi:hypothetical protein
VLHLREDDEQPGGCEEVKKPTLKALKARAWKLMSEYIRRKDADQGGTNYCFTCGQPKFWKELQAGHFIGGRTNAVLLNEEVIRPQCLMCNVFLHGNYGRYTLKMVDEVGREKVEELMSLKHKVVKYTRTDLEEKIAELKAKIKDLEPA